MSPLAKLLLIGTGIGFSPLLPSWAKEPAPVLEESVAAETTAEAVVTKEEPAPAPPTDPMAGEAKEATPPPEKEEAPEDETEKKKLPPITPDLANLNLATDLELVTLDTQEKVFLPAGTYRQILRIPIDSPTMQSAKKTRLERRPEVKVADPLPRRKDRKKNLFGSVTSPSKKSKSTTKSVVVVWMCRSMDRRSSSSVFGTPNRKPPIPPVPFFIFSLAAWDIRWPISGVGRPGTPGRSPATSNIG